MAGGKGQIRQHIVEANLVEDYHPEPTSIYSRHSSSSVDVG